MSNDGLLHDQLRGVGETYLRLAEDRPRFARRQAEYWAQVARLEKQTADRARADWRKPRPPSGQFAAVHKELAPIVDHSRAKTEKHDLSELAAEGEVEFRPTPVVPDPRKL